MTKSTQVASATLSILNTNIRCIDGLYSLNDLHKAAGGAEKHKPTFFLRNEQTKALIEEIDNENSQVANLQPAIKVINGGHNRGTYACREIVVAYGAWINATVHLAVIRAFLDTVSPYITDEQLNHIKQGVGYMVHATGKHWQSVYRALFDYVGAPSLREIRKERYGAACRWLGIKEDAVTPPADVAGNTHPFDMLGDGRYELNIKGKDITVKDISCTAAIEFDLSRDGDYLVQVEHGHIRHCRIAYYAP